MGQQGTYPIGSRVVALTDTLTGVVTGVTADVPLSALASVVAMLTGNQTLGGVKTFSSPPVFPSTPVTTTPQSMVRVASPNGYGSTNTKIARFLTTVLAQGADITYADSATLGGSLTVATAGVYSMQLNGAGPLGMHLGISRNTTQPTVDVLSLTNPLECIASAQVPVANYQTTTGQTMFLSAGDVIRVHTDAQALVNNSYCQFTMTRLA